MPCVQDDLTRRTTHDAPARRHALSSRVHDHVTLLYTYTVYKYCTEYIHSRDDAREP